MSGFDSYGRHFTNVNVYFALLQIRLVLIFSKHEVTFTFAICCRPSVCLLMLNAPYSGGCNFPQYFYGIWYLGHPLTSFKNFTEIVQGEPLRRGS